MRAKVTAIKMELRKHIHDPIADTGVWVKQMLPRHLNYYAVSGNHPSIGGDPVSLQLVSKEGGTYEHRKYACSANG
jgi:hypothetical protein